jgi:hypothetical protein
MSDPVGYIACSVIGPDSRTALAWLRRTQAWDRRLDQLREADVADPEPGEKQPPTAA